MSPRELDELLGQAVAHHQAARLDEAERGYRAVLETDAGNADALHLLGVVAHQRGHGEEAVALISRAVELRPDDPRFHNNLGEALRGLGRTGEAADAYAQAVALKPDYAEALNNLSLALHALGRDDEAADAAERAIRARPNYAKAWNNLGIIRASRDGRFADARAAYETAIRLKPDYAEAHANLATLLADHGMLGPAEAAYRRALAINPEYANAYNGLGGLLGRQGKLDEAIEKFRHGLRLVPDAARNSNLLLYLQYSPDVSPAELLAEHRAWDRLYAQPLKGSWRPHANERAEDRRLRIGYVSADLRSHPVAYFFEPVLDAHDRGQVEVFCYASVARPDDVSARLRAKSDVWREVLRSTDAQLAEQVRDDRIDVLVDLSVHLAKHRLLAFARKPAPVQMSYLGYPGTTGVEAIDYRLSDPHLDPPGRADETRGTETILRLPETYFCYRPDPRSPDITPPPSASAGRVTFASVNTLLKLSPAVYETWSRILARVPDARLIMQTSGLDDPATQAIVRERFARRGVAPDRLEFAGFSDFSEFLRLFDRVDVALDAFPYSSGTTTCHTLWMGVPVVTLAGELAVQRMGLSVLANVGLGELVATTPEHYVEVAVVLAGDPARRAALRATMRDRMRASPLLDGPRQARNLERLYRDAWQRWVAQSAGQ